MFIFSKTAIECPPSPCLLEEALRWRELRLKTEPIKTWNLVDDQKFWEAYECYKKPMALPQFQKILPDTVAQY